MRVAGVGAGEAVHPESKPVPGRSLLHLALSLFGLLPAHLVFAGQPLDGGCGAARRHGRVELKRVVGHRDLVPALKRLERSLEAPLAEVAPRAHHVRPDINMHDRVTPAGHAAFPRGPLAVISPGQAAVRCRKSQVAAKKETARMPPQYKTASHASSPTVTPAQVRPIHSPPLLSITRPNPRPPP